MNDLSDALGAVLGLAVGGLIFIVFGRALDSTQFIDLQFWGILLVIASVVLGGVVVVGVISALLEGVV